MALLQTPRGDLGSFAPEFKLLGVNGQHYQLLDCRQDKGLLVMFICNHCPYVQAILTRLVSHTARLQTLKIGCVAICSNDALAYPEDNYENMQHLAKSQHFTFPYLWDETQAVAKAYGAVCTPDFFGFNSELSLQYRGRLDASGIKPAPEQAKAELVEAMQLIAATGKGPMEQIPSQGCSIKWRT